MRKPEQEQEYSDPKRPLIHLMPTLLDRLMDEEPGSRVDKKDGGAITSEEVRNILQRDLAMLFNTINHEAILDSEEWPELASSVLNYGIPPVSGGYTSEMRWTAMEKILRTAIIRFEPRLLADTLRITPLIKDDNNYNVLLFEIYAFIHMDPYPLEFAVQSALDLENHKISVTLLEETGIQNQ